MILNTVTPASWIEAFERSWPDTRGQFSELADTLRFSRKKSQICFIGNGGSAAIASHMAIDFFNKGKFLARSFNDAAALTCISNDYGYKSVFDMQVSRVLKHGDVLVAISSSGESENVVRAANSARLICTVATFSGFIAGNRLSRIGHFNFHVPSSNYGIVETAHLGLLHALLEAVTE